MVAFPISRFFRLSDEGVRCDERGLFVGGEPMLVRLARPRGGYAWATRSADDQNRDLGARYGFPIDAAVKRGGFGAIARALELGDIARAHISALLLRFPEPPSLGKSAPARGSAELAKQLIESGLLKADWDSAKHPRTGEPPNPGWFAPREDAPAQVAQNEFEPKPTMSDAEPSASRFAPIVDEKKPLATIEAEPEPPPNDEAGPGQTPESELESAPSKEDLSPRELMKSLREFLKREAFPIIETGGLVDWAASKLSDAIAQTIVKLQLLETASPAEVDQIVLRALAEAQAAKDPPRTLAELQTPPTQNAAGYDDHHMVQQNKANIAKSPLVVAIEKFGWNVINAPSNRVWVPRVKHRLITDWYNGVDPNDPKGRRRREVVSDMDYDAQYQDALATLRRFGVLQ